jgi:hypothetical protein
MVGCDVQSFWWSESLGVSPSRTCPDHSVRRQHPQAVEPTEDCSCQEVSFTCKFKFKTLYCLNKIAFFNGKFSLQHSGGTRNDIKSFTKNRSYNFFFFFFFLINYWGMQVQEDHYFIFKFLLLFLYNNRSCKIVFFIDERSCWYRALQFVLLT